MLNLFKIEWMKVKGYRAFWVLFGSFIILFPLSFYIFVKLFIKTFGAATASNQENMLKEMLGDPTIFPRVWLSSSWFGGIFVIILGMLYILLVTNEVQYRTHRQNIIDGWSRFDFLKAKFSVLIFFVLVSTLMVFLCGFLTGQVYTPANGASMTDGIYYLGYFALMATMYLLVAFLIAILVKRTGLSIIIYFAYVCLLDNILWGLLTMNNGQTGYFLPLETTDSLIPAFFKPYLFEKRTLADSTLIISAVIYMVVFAAVIKNYFQKTDLKT